MATDARESFIGEIMLVSFNFPPQGWAFCDGQQLQINQNQPLFALLGTNYGGNGQTTFALPDLRGRVPMHMGNSHTMGERGGEQAHTLTQGEMPLHVHFANATSIPATASNPANNRLLSQSIQAALYANPSNPAAMDPQAISNVGGSQAHQNMQPFLTLTYCIALQGLFPSRD
jgi:microcystin-dependent protein